MARKRKEKITELECILDTCPKSKEKDWVDYRDCIKCAYFRGQETPGINRCAHPKAKREKKDVREARRSVFKKLPYINLVGPKRY